MGRHGKSGCLICNTGPLAKSKSHGTKLVPPNVAWQLSPTLAHKSMMMRPLVLLMPEPLMADSSNDKVALAPICVYLAAP